MTSQYLGKFPNSGFFNRGKITCSTHPASSYDYTTEIYILNVKYFIVECSVECFFIMKLNQYRLTIRSVIIVRDK